MEHTNEDVESLATKIAALGLPACEQSSLGAALQANDPANGEIEGFTHQARLGDLLLTKGVVSGPSAHVGRHFEAPGSESKQGFTLNEELLYRSR
ncbi:MAG: hypothetical protein ACI9TF_000541 [Paracrocinitomix sp.]|jgi:hypothetical protein